MDEYIENEPDKYVREILISNREEALTAIKRHKSRIELALRNVCSDRIGKFLTKLHYSKEKGDAILVESYEKFVRKELESLDVYRNRFGIKTFAEQQAKEGN